MVRLVLRLLLGDFSQLRLERGFVLVASQFAGEFDEAVGLGLDDWPVWFVRSHRNHPKSHLGGGLQALQVVLQHDFAALLGAIYGRDCLATI